MGRWSNLTDVFQRGWNRRLVVIPHTTHVRYIYLHLFFFSLIPPRANVVKKATPSCLEQFAPHLDRWSGKPNPTGCDCFGEPSRPSFKVWGIFHILWKIKFLKILFHGPFGFSEFEKPKGWETSSIFWWLVWVPIVRTWLINCMKMTSKPATGWSLANSLPFAPWEISELTDYQLGWHYHLLADSHCWAKDMVELMTLLNKTHNTLTGILYLDFRWFWGNPQKHCIQIKKKEIEHWLSCFFSNSFPLYTSKHLKISVWTPKYTLNTVHLRRYPPGCLGIYLPIICLFLPILPFSMTSICRSCGREFHNSQAFQRAKPWCFPSRET